MNGSWLVVLNQGASRVDFLSDRKIVLILIVDFVASYKNALT